MAISTRRTPGIRRTTGPPGPPGEAGPAAIAGSNEEVSQATAVDGFGTPIAPSVDQFNRLPLLLITLFLGGAGGHKIYLQKYPLAALYILFFWTGIPTLVAITELILCAAQSDQEFAEKYPQPAKKELYLSIALPLIAMTVTAIIYAVAFSGPASPGTPNELAANDASACRNSLEGYYAQKRSFPETAQELVVTGCRSSESVALFVLPRENHYVIVSYHHEGDKAYLLSRSTDGPQELDKGKAVAELANAFKIVDEIDGVTLISQ